MIKKRSHHNIQTITIVMLIEENFVCSQTHRAFFEEQIENAFSFSVAFQKWLKENTGKTYQDAINAYYQILSEKKKHRTTIDKQFEYHTYIQAFFEDNKKLTLKEAIQCWNYKKGLAGHNRYQKADIRSLSK